MMNDISDDDAYTPDLHPWEYPLGHPDQKDRDIAAAPYDRQEQRAVNFLWNAGMGGGDDPIGFLIASTAYSRAETRERDAEIARLRGVRTTLMAELGSRRRVSLLTEDELELLSRLVRQVAVDDPEWWGTTEAALAQLLPKLV